MADKKTWQECQVFETKGTIDEVQSCQCRFGGKAHPDRSKMSSSESTCELCKWRGVHDKHCYYGYEQGELVKDNDHCSHFNDLRKEKQNDSN